MADRFCERCSLDISKRHVQARFCSSACKAALLAARGGCAAHRAVRDAILRGDLPPAKTQVCVDCGLPAHDYDHRDYGKPLAVDPVCRSCNCKRGPAAPAIWPELIADKAAPAIAQAAQA